MDNARSYRVVCFDLDGTLLPMDIDEFMSAYFKRIATFMASHGLDPEKFMMALKAGIKAMANHNDDSTNSQAFWHTFGEAYGAEGQQLEDMHKLADEFYDVDFVHIGDGFVGNPSAARSVEKLLAKGYPVVLTTMPMFPVHAVDHRLAWAGVDPQAFSRITNYDNSKSVKPEQTYFAENLAAMGVSGKDVLMVGNNTMEDLSFLDLGVDAYLVTDCLLDPIGFDLESVKHGSLEEFEAWVDTLPACENPAADISKGLVSDENMRHALEANAIEGIDLDARRKQAALVADAAASDHAPGSAGSMKVS